MKADGSNIEEIVAGLLFWFNDPKGHQPAMQSDIFQRGWGNGYQLLGKLVPCSEIPAKFKGRADLAVNALGDKKPYFEELLDTWSSLCNVWYDPVWSPAGGKCKGNTSGTGSNTTMATRNTTTGTMMPSSSSSSSSSNTSNAVPAVKQGNLSTSSNSTGSITVAAPPGKSGMSAGMSGCVLAAVALLCTVVH